MKQLLSDNNKRGRPPKAKPALVRDDDDADKPSQVPRSNINVRPYRKQNWNICTCVKSLWKLMFDLDHVIVHKFNSSGPLI